MNPVELSQQAENQGLETVPGRGESFDFCPPFPWLSQNLIKGTHLAVCIIPDSVVH